MDRPSTVDSPAPTAAHRSGASRRPGLRLERLVSAEGVHEPQTAGPPGRAWPNGTGGSSVRPHGGRGRGHGGLMARRLVLPEKSPFFRDESPQQAVVRLRGIYDRSKLTD